MLIAISLTYREKYSEPFVSLSGSLVNAFVLWIQARLVWYYQTKYSKNKSVVNSTLHIWNALGVSKFSLRKRVYLMSYIDLDKCIC